MLCDSFNHLIPCCPLQVEDFYLLSLHSFLEAFLQCRIKYIASATTYPGIHQPVVPRLRSESNMIQDERSQILLKLQRAGERPSMGLPHCNATYASTKTTHSS